MHDDESFGQCVCGSAWFRLEVPDDYVAEQIDLGPAVCIDAHGSITGYAGKLVCIGCERDWDPNVTFKPTRSHLRVVGEV